METSAAKSEKEIESNNLLYKYQYAFLHMQKSFTSLFKVIHALEQKVSYKYLTSWKKKCLVKPYQVSLHLVLLKSTLKSLDIKLKARSRILLLSYFLQVIRHSRLKKFYAEMQNQYNKAKEENSKELVLMENEVLSLKQSQTELENITKNYSKREFNLKMRLESLKGKGSKEALKSENTQLRLKIGEMDKRIMSMFTELNEALDGLEEAKKKKALKLRKKAKIIIKGKNIPIFV